MPIKYYTVGNKLATLNNGDTVLRWHDIYNPLDLPPNTIRFMCEGPASASWFRYADSLALVSADNNYYTYDLSASTNNWDFMLTGVHIKLRSILGANTTNVTSMSNPLYGATGLSSCNIFDTSNCTSLQSLFHDCFRLTAVPKFDTSKSVSLAGFVSECNVPATFPAFDSSNASSTVSMFRGCNNLVEAPLIDTTNVIDASWMYTDCTALSSIPPLSLPNVTNVYNMFCNCSAVESGISAMYAQLSANTAITSYNHCFYNCGVGTEQGAAELALIPDDWKS